MTSESVRMHVLSFFFFFQAEDGIRDLTVTGVQTCALPISRRPSRGTAAPCRRRAVKRGYPRGAGTVRLCRDLGAVERLLQQRLVDAVRSGERRGGEEWRSWGAADH